MRNNKHTFFTLRRFIAICMAMLVMLGANATALTAESGQDITTGDEPVTETAVSSTPETTKDTDEKEITSEDSEEEIEETDIPASEPETEIISEGEPETEPKAEDNPEPEGELKTEGEPEETATASDIENSEISDTEEILPLDNADSAVSDTEGSLPSDNTDISQDNGTVETTPLNVEQIPLKADTPILKGVKLLNAADEASKPLTVKIYIYAWDENGEYEKVGTLSKSGLTEGDTASWYIPTYFGGKVKNTTVTKDGKQYKFSSSSWKYADGTRIPRTQPDGTGSGNYFAVKYEDAAAITDEAGVAEYSVYAGYRPDVQVTLIFLDIRHHDGTTTTSSESNILSAEVGWNFTKKKLETRTALRVGEVFSYTGYEYKYTGYWTDDRGNVIDASSTISFTNSEGTTSGNHYYVDEDTVISFTPEYIPSKIRGLDYNYIDNISTGSGSWSNANAYEYRSQVGSLTHTYADPSEKTPVSDYQFKYWEIDEEIIKYPNGSKEIKTPEKKYYAGESHVYWVNSGLPAGTDTEINVYAYWQPAITVNYHVMGSVAKSEKNYSEVKVYDYTPEDKGNIHFEGWYSDPELTQRIDESAVETAPAITKDKDTAKVVDVYARFVTAKTVSKVWDDTDDKDGIRPASVQVQLNKAGEASGEPVTLSADNKWTYTFEDLTAYDKDGSEIEYTIDEVEVPRGYTKTVVSEEDTVTITNAHTINPTPTPTITPTPTTTPKPTATPTPTSTPTPESKSDKTPAPTMTPDYVVTCQMAGYPANYAWNEAAKACQPGYIDDFGVFHSTAARRVIPNTYDKGLMGNLITFMISDLLGIAIVLILKKY
ncbi:MAG: Cna B-type domain-containing protein [Solobacterium sp.]|nr:Cna B-type domain-containing protein [Solobacterium sp.]